MTKYKVYATSGDGGPADEYVEYKSKVNKMIEAGLDMETVFEWVNTKLSKDSGDCQPVGNKATTSVVDGCHVYQCSRGMYGEFTDILIIAEETTLEETIGKVVKDIADANTAKEQGMTIEEYREYCARNA